MVCGRDFLGYWLTIPFIAKRVDLIGKFDQILVGTAFIMADYSNQALTGSNETQINIGSPDRFLFYGGLLLVDMITVTQPCACQKIKGSTGIWCLCIITMLVTQAGCKRITDIVLAMNNKHLFGLGDIASNHLIR